jgi:hypothetical protein
MNVPEGALVIFRDPATGRLRVGLSPHMQYWSAGGSLTVQVDTEPFTLFVATVVRVV